MEVILGVVFLCAFDFPIAIHAPLGHNDFSTFYAGAKLAHTPALYNHEIVRQTVRAGWPDSQQYVAMACLRRLVCCESGRPARTVCLTISWL